MEELDGTIHAAIKETAVAEAAVNIYQELLQTTRTTAHDFDLDLQALRNSLTSLTSRQDKDYQKLRVQGAQIADEDDDSNASVLPTVVQPVASGGTPF